MEVWKAGPDVDATVKDLIANHFPDLAALDDEIAIVFREKATKNGDAIIAGKTGKAPALLGILGEVDFKFVITLGADHWTTLGDKEQRALLFHHLCGCGVEENPQSGVMRCYVRLPDVAFYKEEVQEFGFWREGGGVPDDNTIIELFGT